MDSGAYEITIFWPSVSRRNFLNYEYHIFIKFSREVMQGDIFAALLAS
jgi:hypothetical protein